MRACPEGGVQMLAHAGDPPAAASGSPSPLPTGLAPLWRLNESGSLQAWSRCAAERRIGMCLWGKTFPCLVGASLLLRLCACTRQTVSHKHTGGSGQSCQQLCTSRPAWRWGMLGLWLFSCACRRLFSFRGQGWGVARMCLLRSLLVSQE